MVVVPKSGLEALCCWVWYMFTSLSS